MITPTVMFKTMAFVMVIASLVAMHFKVDYAAWAFFVGLFMFCW